MGLIFSQQAFDKSIINQNRLRSNRRSQNQFSSGIGFSLRNSCTDAPCVIGEGTSRCGVILNTGNCDAASDDGCECVDSAYLIVKSMVLGQ